MQIKNKMLNTLFLFLSCVVEAFVKKKLTILKLCQKGRKKVC